MTDYKGTIKPITELKEFSKRTRELLAGDMKKTSSVDGLSRQTVSRFINDHTDPALSSILKILKQNNYGIIIVDLDVKP